MEAVDINEDKIQSGKTKDEMIKKQLFNHNIVKRKDLSQEQENKIQENFNVIKFQNATGMYSEFNNFFTYFDFNNHADEQLQFMNAAREVQEIDHKYDNISFVEHYLENKVGIPVFKNGKRISPEWTDEEKEKYLPALGKINAIAQAIVNSHTTYTEILSDNNNNKIHVQDNTDRLQLFNAGNLDKLEETLQKMKHELNPYEKEIDKTIDNIEINSRLSEVAVEADNVNIDNENELAKANETVKKQEKEQTLDELINALSEEERKSYQEELDNIRKVKDFDRQEHLYDQLNEKYGIKEQKEDTSYHLDGEQVDESFKIFNEQNKKLQQQLAQANETIKKQQKEINSQKAVFTQNVTLTVPQYDKNNQPVKDRDGKTVTVTLNCPHGINAALGKMAHTIADLKFENQQLRTQNKAISQEKNKNISKNISDDSGMSY